MKQLRKDVIDFAATGVGLGIMSSLDSTGSTGKLGKGLGIAGEVMMMGHTMRIIDKAMPKRRF